MHVLKDFWRDNEEGDESCSKLQHLNDVNRKNVKTENTRQVKIVLKLPKTVYGVPVTVTSVRFLSDDDVVNFLNDKRSE